MVRVKAKSLSLALLLCFYVIFAFSINPFMDDFLGMSIEVTEQKNEGVFSSLSRNFDQTVEEINGADEKSTSLTDSSTSTDEKSTSSTPSTDSSTSADEENTASNVPIAAIESSNLISSNSTTTDDLGKNNQTNFDQ